MLGLYLMVRLVAIGITYALIGFAIILVFVWTIFCMICVALMDPKNWRSNTAVRSNAIKNPRLYYSDRS
jgi:hypothetical protein